MTDNTLKSQRQPWYKNYMITVFVIGLPAFVVVACIIFVVYAVKNKDATVRDDWYMDGKTLYQDASKDQLAHDMQLHGVLRFDEGVVRFELRRPDDTADYPDTLTLSISHATDKDKDRDTTLIHEAEGVYVGEVALDPLPSKYYLHITSDTGWRLTQTYKLPAGNVPFAPLPSFDEHQLTLPDQRDKRINQAVSD